MLTLYFPFYAFITKTLFYSPPGKPPVLMTNIPLRSVPSFFSIIVSLFMHTHVVKYTQPKIYEKRTSIHRCFQEGIYHYGKSSSDISENTAFINVKLPIAANGGLIHLGNVPLFIGAILFGKKTGAIAGGIGMGLFDLLSGWTLWAPFTLIIVGIMGFTVGKLTEDHRHQNMKWYVIAIAAACVIKVVGYYIAEVIIYGNPLAPVSSIPGNLVQIGVAAVIVLIVITPLNLAARKTGLKKQL